MPTCRQNGRELAKRRFLVADEAGDEEPGHVDQREERRDHHACQQWPTPLLDGVLHEARSGGLLPQVDEHEGQDDARQEHRE
jgi:hypothetical protein